MTTIATRSWIRAVSILGLGLWAGCVPMPVHLLETAEVLPDKQVALTAGGGGGLWAMPELSDTSVAEGQPPLGTQGYFAPTVRVRVGLGADQELSVTATAGANVDDGKVSFAGVGTRVAWKHAFGRYLALTAGGTIGYLHERSFAFGPDVGLIVSDRHATARVRPYTGLRFTLGAGVAADPAASDHRPILTEHFTLPLGVAIGLDAAHRSRLYLEASMDVAPVELPADPGYGYFATAVAGYFGAAVEFDLHRSAATPSPR